MTKWDTDFLTSYIIQVPGSRPRHHAEHNTRLAVLVELGKLERIREGKFGKGHVVKLAQRPIGFIPASASAL